MTITLDGQDAQDYIDYYDDLQKLKYGEVSQPRLSDRLATETSKCVQVDPKTDSLLAQLQDFNDDRPQSEYDHREVSTTFPIGDEGVTTTVITRTSAPKRRWTRAEIADLDTIAATEPTLESLISQLHTDRTEMAIRTQLNILGFRVRDGKVFYHGTN